MSPGGAENGTLPPVKDLGPGGPDVPNLGGPDTDAVPKVWTGAVDGLETAYIVIVVVLFFSSICVL